MIGKNPGEGKGFEFQSHWLCGLEQIAEPLCIADSPTVR